jgi:DNA helicase-2/ATP-dependent DNA helicase PcrA
MEEERRLFYVGMTRAERLLYLTYASSRNSYGRFGYSAPSRFLRAIPDHLVRSLGRRGALRPGAAPNLRGRVRGDGLTPGDSSSPAEETRSAAPALAYEVGQRVFHPHFGEGIVLEVKDKSGDQEVAVEFVRNGNKRLLASLAAMEIIDDAADGLDENDP